MNLSLDTTSALRVFRALRARGVLDARPRCELLPPNPAPRIRWTAGMLPMDCLLLDEKPTADNPLYVVAPTNASRIKASFVRCATLSGALPPGSFIRVGEGISVPCPELLFMRAATVMPFHMLCLLGYELCGSYVRDAFSPRNGGACYGVPAVTTLEKMRAYVLSCRYVKGSVQAIRALEYVQDNAWSPMEALISMLLKMPGDLLGYGIGGIVLNERKAGLEMYVDRGCRESRVPDILIAGTSVGFNYDGYNHFDLVSVAEAAMTGEQLPAMRRVRSKYVDDLRRNRELAAMGYAILPVTFEDLCEEGGLDTVVLEALDIIGFADDGRLDGVAQEIANDAQRAAERQALIRLCLPGSR